MHVDKNTIVGGLPAKEARDFFRSIGTNTFCESALDQKLLFLMLEEALIEADIDESDILWLISNHLRAPISIHELA